MFVPVWNMEIAEDGQAADQRTRADETAVTATTLTETSAVQPAATPKSSSNH